MPNFTTKPIIAPPPKMPDRHNIFSAMRNWLSTPLGVVLIAGTVALVTELSYMVYIEGWIKAQFGLSDIILELIDIAILTSSVSPALYLVFRKIKEGEAKLNKITESAQDAIVMMDSNQRVSFWNAAAGRIFGYTESEAMGQKLHSLIVPASAQEAFALGFRNFLENGKGSMVGKVIEVTAVRRGGEEFPAELSISSVRIKDHWHSVGIVRDITERKKNEGTMEAHRVALVQINQSLSTKKKEAENRKAEDDALLASLGEGMIATNNSGVVTNINHIAEEMLGWNAHDIIGKVFTETVQAINESGEIIPADKRVINLVLACAETGTPISLHQHPTSESLYYVQKSGERIPISATINPIILNGKIIGAVEIFHDTTKEKEIEKTRGDLLALASHQLRTPLSGTKWLIETLQSGLKGALNRDQKEYLDEIYKINQRMTSLVVDMLGVLRMEGGAIQINRSSVSTTTILDTLLETFTPVAKSKKLTLRIERDSEHTVETDPLLLRNIIESLVSNAMTYSNEGGEVVISLQESAGEMVFAVKDSGIGIPKEEQGQLFERFYRASNAKTFNTIGTGLGLYIATTLAKKIGARLSFESEKDKGSTFFVHIPYYKSGVLPEGTTRV